MIDIAYKLLKKHLLDKVVELQNVYYYNPLIDNLEKEPELPLPMVMLQFQTLPYSTLADETQQCTINITVHLYNEFDYEVDDIVESLSLRNKIHKALHKSKHNLKQLEEFEDAAEDIRVLNSLVRENSNVTHPYYQISKTVDVYKSLFTDASAKISLQKTNPKIEISGQY